MVNLNHIVSDIINIVKEISCDSKASENISVDMPLVGSVKVGSNTFIGLRAVIVNGIHINDNVTIGAAARVSRDVSEGLTVFPSPSKTIKL